MIIVGNVFNIRSYSRSFVAKSRENKSVVAF